MDLTTTVPPVLRLPLGVLAGVLATFAMDVAMARLPEGATPPTVASGVLTGTHPDGAPGRLASVVHYVAGWLTGPLFVWLLYAAEVAVGVGLLATLGATTVLFALMVGFFVVVVLPRVDLPAQRLRQVRRDWALSAAAYLVVLVPVVAVGSSLL